MKSCYGPECHGCRLLAHTLEVHGQLLVQPLWDCILNYETQLREEIYAYSVSAVCEA